jgi:hypothetical protein
MHTAVSPMVFEVINTERRAKFIYYVYTFVRKFDSYLPNTTASHTKTPILLLFTTWLPQMSWVQRSSRSCGQHFLYSYLTMMFIVQVIVPESVRQWWNNIDSVQAKHWRKKKTCPIATLPSTNPTWAGIKPCPPRGIVPRSIPGPQAGYYERSPSQSSRQIPKQPQIRPQQLRSTHLAIH